MALEDEIARIFGENIDFAPIGTGRNLASIDGAARRLPRLRGVPGISIEDENTAVFILETDTGEKVHLPVDGKTLPLIANLIRYVLKGASGMQRDDGFDLGALTPQKSFDG